MTTDFFIDTKNAQIFKAFVKLHPILTLRWDGIKAIIGDVIIQVSRQDQRDFYNWSEELRKSRKKLIIVGDYNIAHTEMDIHNPKGNKKNSGFLPEERAWMTKWFENGFTDAYRFLNPEKIEYSWWSYRANARANNKGWRIDYQSVTNNLKDKLIKSYHLSDAKHSDHCPVYLEIDL